MTDVRTDRDSSSARSIASTAEPATFDKLRELTRSGYVPVAEQERSDGGILLRHESAPDLVLHIDGRLDLPTGQAAKSSRSASSQARGKRIYWLRTLFVVALIVTVWILSLALTAGLLESMD